MGNFTYCVHKKTEAAPSRTTPVFVIPFVSCCFSAPSHTGSHPLLSHAPPNFLLHPYPRSMPLQIDQAHRRFLQVSCIPSECSDALHFSFRRRFPDLPGISGNFHSGYISHYNPPCKWSLTTCPCRRLRKPFPFPSASLPVRIEAGSHTGLLPAHTRRSCRTGHGQGRP